jgi:hypothetical protein
LAQTTTFRLSALLCLQPKDAIYSFKDIAGIDQVRRGLLLGCIDAPSSHWAA